MSSNAPGPRPRQVTVGGWAVAVASAMLVVTVFDTMARLHSVDTRDTLTKALTTGSAKDLGISVDQALAVMRVALYVAGTAAAVTAVLGIYVLRRHAAARIVLTIAAVPVVLTAPVAGGFLGVVVGGATVLLWSQPARDWFAGRPASQPAATRAAPWTAPRTPRADDRPVVPAPPDRSQWAPPAGPPSPQGPLSLPPPTTQGWGQPAHSPAARVPAYGTRPAYPAPGRSDMPVQVRVACVLTWAFSVLTAGVYLLVALGLAVDRAGILRLLRDNPAVRGRSVSDDRLVAFIVAGAVLVLIWCVVACVLAALVWRRRPLARILLLVSVAVAAGVEVFSLPYSALHLVAAVVVIRLLLGAPARAWFGRDDRPGPSASPVEDWPPPSGPPSPPHDHGQDPPPPAW